MSTRRKKFNEIGINEKKEYSPVIKMYFIVSRPFFITSKIITKEMTVLGYRLGPR